MSTFAIRKKQFPLAGWLSIASCAMLVDLLLKGQILGLFLCIGIGCAAAVGHWKPKPIMDGFGKISRWTKRATDGSKILVSSLNVLLWAFYFTTLTLLPAHAAFLDGAEAAFSTVFTSLGGEAATGAATFIPVIFGLLRLIFVIFVIASIIRIVAAGRNDDDWVQLAKTPAVIAVTIFVGDFLIGLIVV